MIKKKKPVPIEKKCQFEFFHGKDRIDFQIGDLAKIGAVIGRVERMPELLNNGAAAFGKDLREAAALLMPEGVILRHSGNALIALLECPISQWAGEGAARIAGGTHNIRNTAALCQFVGSNDRNEIGQIGRAHV